MKPLGGVRPGDWRGAAVGVLLFGALCGAVSASAGQGAPAGTDELAHLRAAHRARPDDAQTALELGLLLHQNDKASLEAQTLLEGASRRFPHRHDVHLKLLESYLLRKNGAAVGALLARLQPELESSDELAFEVARCLVQHGAIPDDPQKALQLGLFLFERDNASLEAQRLLDSASRRFPLRHDVHLRLLESYLLQENVPAATALLERLQPELDASTRLTFDVIYSLLQHRQLPLAQGQWKTVDARVLQATRQRSQQGASEVPEALFVQGLLATVAGQKDDALRLFHRADSQGFPPHDSPQMLMLADSLYWLEEFRPAADAYAEAVRRFPQNVQARLRLGASLYWTSRLPEAREEIERVLRESPRQIEANLYLGLVLFALKRNDEARACFEKELTLDPSCGVCMAKLAHLAYMAGDDGAARTWLEKAVALGAASPEIDLVYGMIANRAGEYDVAIRHLSRAVERVPEFAQAQYQLATAYQRSGNREKADEHFARYRKLTEAQSAPPATGSTVTGGDEVQ